MGERQKPVEGSLPIDNVGDLIDARGGFPLAAVGSQPCSLLRGYGEVCGRIAEQSTRIAPILASMNQPLTG